MNGFKFVMVGIFAVAVYHIASVQFNADGSAVVHTISNSMTTSDPDEVAILHDMVGHNEPKERGRLVSVDPAGDPPPPPPGPQLVKDPVPAADQLKTV